MERERSRTDFGDQVQFRRQERTIARSAMVGQDMCGVEGSYLLQHGKPARRCAAVAEAVRHGLVLHHVARNQLRSGSTKVSSSPLVWAPNQSRRAVTPPRSIVASWSKITSGGRKTTPASSSLFCGERWLNISIISWPCFSISCCCTALRISMVPGGKPGSPAACSGWKCVVVRKSFGLLGASFAATRAAVVPFFGPRPVSTTSVAWLPTTMARLGKPMIAQTWSEIFVGFSSTIGWLICAKALVAAFAASVSSAESDFIASLFYDHLPICSDPPQRPC